MDLAGLFRSIKLDDLRAVEKWCASGNSVNVLDPSSFKKSTPLHWAAYNGSAPIVTVLINHGANVNAEESDKKTPLHLSAFEGQYDAAEVLLTAGAEYRCRDAPGKTPCDLAIMNGHLDVARLFPNFSECYQTSGSQPGENFAFGEKPSLNFPSWDSSSLRQPKPSVLGHPRPAAISAFSDRAKGGADLDRHQHAYEAASAPYKAEKLSAKGASPRRDSRAEEQLPE
eukprot:gene18213-28057_t